MKKYIQPFDHAGNIAKALPGGILLTTCAGKRIDSMTIGWGLMGIEWGKPIFTVFVRESRFSRQLLDQSGEFSVNAPLGTCHKNVLAVCGTSSGRDVDKIAALGLTTETAERICAPGIREFPLTLECRVIYRQEQDLSVLARPCLEAFYPRGTDMADPAARNDRHIAYYGEIVSAYIIE